jgi:8-amino-7-oxononanoate synthase
VPYGTRGNAIVRHHAVGYDNIVLVGGFSKAYSSMLAFVACSTVVKNHLKVAAPTYLYSGPVPTASLATVLAGLDVNAARGDALRSHLHRLTSRVLEHLADLHVYTPNTSGFPLVEVPLRSAEDLPVVARKLLDRGVYATLAPYPGVPREDVGFRIQLTAAHTDEHIDGLLEVLSDLAEPALRPIG